MSVETSDHIVQSLENWHTILLTNDLDQAEKIHNEIKESIKQNPDPSTELYYQLLNGRYLILKRDLSAAHAILEGLDGVYGERQDPIGFSLHLFIGILSTIEGEYEVAEDRFILAYRLLDQIKDETVKADFFYKASILYYHIRQPLNALNYASEALKLLSAIHGFEVIKADCENILGLASTSIKQYGKAEEHFLSALDMAKKENCLKLITLIKYNIGYLYAEQNISELAIRYLLEVYEEEEPYHKTIFLLAREFYRMKDHRAEDFFKKGIMITNEEYKHHFQITRAFHIDLDGFQLEQIVTEGIKYFKKHELWGFVEDYAGELAQYFYKKGDHNHASHYFNEAYLAKRTLQKKEELK